MSSKHNSSSSHDARDIRSPHGRSSGSRRGLTRAPDQPLRGDISRYAIQDDDRPPSAVDGVGIFLLLPLPHPELYISFTTGWLTFRLMSNMIIISTWYSLPSNLISLPIVLALLTWLICPPVLPQTFHITPVRVDVYGRHILVFSMTPELLHPIRTCRRKMIPNL